MKEVTGKLQPKGQFAVSHVTDGREHSGQGNTIPKGLAAGGEHHVFEEAAVDLSVPITPVKMKYEGELWPKGERQNSEGLFRQVKELRVYLEDNGEESLKVLDRYGVIRVAF